MFMFISASLLSLFLAVCMSISVYVHWEQRKPEKFLECAHLANKADSWFWEVG